MQSSQYEENGPSLNSLSRFSNNLRKSIYEIEKSHDLFNYYFLCVRGYKSALEDNFKNLFWRDSFIYFAFIDIIITFIGLKSVNSFRFKMFCYQISVSDVSII